MSRSIRSGRKLWYRITGTLPAPWEDFYAAKPDYPNVTIITEGNRHPDDETFETVDGWRLAFVPAAALTMDQAMQELARINGVDVGDILISEDNFLQAT